MSTDTEIDITIKLAHGVMQKMLPKIANYGCNQLEKVLGLYTTRTTTNMNLFNSDQQLNKYTTVYDIINDYYDIRYKLFIKRKKHQIDVLEKDMVKLSNKARFIQEQCVEPPTLVLRKKKKIDVISMLTRKNYDVIDGDAEYKYLRNMSIDSVEEENLNRLLSECGNKQCKLDILVGKNVENIWLEELSELTTHYKLYRANRINRASGIASKKTKIKKLKTTRIKKQRT